MFAVLHFPQFALQTVLRYEPEAWGRPVALIDPGLTTPRVVDATDVAREAGVSDGLTAPQVLARCRQSEIRHRSTQQEAATTDAIVQAAYGFSPNLEATAPGLVTLDLRRLAGLRDAFSPSNTSGSHAWVAWTERLATAVGILGLRVRIGLGPTPTVAQHAARWMGDGGVTAEDSGAEVGAAVPGLQTRSRHVNDGPAFARVTDPTRFVTALPVAALGPSSEVTEILQRWGIRTVGELLALGQAELSERLGLEALALFAAASVSSFRPLRLVQPVECFEESHEFETAIETLEPLLFILRRFVEALDTRLGSFGWVAGTLRFRLRLESGVCLENTLQVPQPTRRPDVLFRMLHTHLETLRTESPVKAIFLTAEPTRAEQKQFGLFESALRDPHQFQETLARLAALVGDRKVGSPQREDSHRPDAFTLVPPVFDEFTSVSGPCNAPDPRRPVPLRRIRPAPLAHVKSAVPPPNGVFEAGPPLSVESAVARGVLSRTVGPWLASGHWWDPASWDREEWDVATVGGVVLRLVHSGGEWRVDGVLD